MMHYIQNPTKIQFELSTVCNALCLGCVRTDASFTQSKFSIPSGSYIDIEQIFKLLKSDAMKTVTALEFCGTIDEPLVHPNFLELLEGLDKRYTIYIHTNGGLRTPTYYTKLAQILHTFSEYEMLFSLDGLENTNHFLVCTKPGLPKSFTRKASSGSVRGIFNGPLLTEHQQKTA